MRTTSTTTRAMTTALGLLLTCAAALPAGAALELPRASQKASLSQTIGLTDMTIRYCRPGVKGRTIWGDLVPYDQVWRTGANEATTITFSEDVKINGQALAKGTYSFHTIPHRDTWTLIFNKTADQWGSYSYDEAQDALRVDVTPRASEMTEWLTFEVPAVQMDSAEVVLRWEKLAVPFTVTAGTVAQGKANIAKALDDMKSDRWRIPYRAADFAFQSKDLDEATRLVDQSIAVEATFMNLNLKARILAEQGKKAEAATTMDKAVAAAREAKNPESVWKPFEKMAAGWRGGK
jgi:hypothetical protein